MNRAENLETVLCESRGDSRASLAFQRDVVAVEQAGACARSHSVVIPRSETILGAAAVRRRSPS